MQRFLYAFLEVLATLAPYLLLGFVIAGVLHAMVPRSLLSRALGGSGAGPILRATLLGIPLPLCSCSVIPIASELRRQGAGRGATGAFMVATPETGVDSISTSVALLHPVLVVVRPIAAMLTALVTGFGIERFTSPPASASAGGGCCHSQPETEGTAKGLRGGLRYAFVDLLGEIAPYLLPAMLLTALLGTFVQPQAFESLAVAPWLQRLIMLLASVPVYVCATSATPVAAGLILAGLSPGAALVFLLAGPATNLVTISAVRQSLGGGAALCYVLVVASMSYLFGSLIDLLWAEGLAAGEAAQTVAHEHLHLLHWLSAGVLGLLICIHLLARLRRKLGS